MLPGPRPHTDHGGESEGGQEGEEAQEEQALNAVIADASEGVHVVLEEGDTQLEDCGAHVGAELVSESPSPSAWIWISSPP